MFDNLLGQNHLEGKTPAAYKRKAERAQERLDEEMYAREAENQHLEEVLAESEQTREAQDSVLKVMSARATFEMTRLEECGLINYQSKLRAEEEAERLRAEENKRTLERDRAVGFARELLDEREVTNKKAMAAATRAALAESDAKSALLKKQVAEERLQTFLAEHDAKRIENEELRVRARNAEEALEDEKAHRLKMHRQMQSEILEKQAENIGLKACVGFNKTKSKTNNI